MDKKRPYLAVILIQAIYAGMFLLSKAAFNGGMNNFVFVFYRQAAATIFLVPFAFVFEWKQAQPLSLKILCQIFMLSLCGITVSLDLYGIALIYTSATLASATINCIPVITFFLALLFRMEVLNLKTKAGVAKLAGIFVCLGGAATLAFYNGPQFKIMGNLHLLRHHINHGQGHVSTGMTWVKGCFLMLMSNTCFALWLVLQAIVLKSYSSKLLFTTLQCFTSAIQAFVIAIAFVRDPNQWKLGWDIKLAAVAYCGFVVTGITFYLQAWVIVKRGPVFLAMSNPLSFIITILSSAILLGENITVGRILGGALLILGLYSVLWGKNREQKMIDENILPTEVDKEAVQLKEVVAEKSPQVLVH